MKKVVGVDVDFGLGGGSGTSRVKHSNCKTYC